MEIQEPARLDEVSPDRRPSCPLCTWTMRRDQDNGVWTCDFHGRGRPRWVERAEAEAP